MGGTVVTLVVCCCLYVWGSVFVCVLKERMCSGVYIIPPPSPLVL